jgi:osmotically-inducible protein OsmY
MRLTGSKQILTIAVVLTLLSAAPLRAEADVQTAGKLQTMLALNQHLGAYDIRVVAADGRLRMEGAVPSTIERTMAEDLANLVANGVPIDNALTLNAPFAEGPGPLAMKVMDLDTATKIRQRLGWQTSTSGLNIDLEIDQGIARLQGKVGGSGAHDAVATLVRTTEGVREVFNYINVDPDALAAERDRQAADAETETEHSDTWIANRVKAVLRYDTTVNVRNIEVSATDGIVLLRGTVTSLAERQVAESLARDILGVRDVESLLTFERPM